MAIIDQYTIRVMRAASVKNIKDCLSALGLEVQSTSTKGRMTTIVASGNNDMTPSQLELRLRELGCTMFSVKDQFSNISANDVPDVNTPDEDIPAAPGTGHDPVDFDVELVNSTLDAMGANLSMAFAQGDAMMDYELMDDPEERNYSEFMNSLADALVFNHDMSEDDAISAIYDCAKDCMEKDLLPPVPEGRGVQPRDYSAFVQAAKSVNMLGLIMQKKMGTSDDVREIR